MAHGANPGTETIAAKASQASCLGPINIERKACLLAKLESGQASSQSNCAGDFEQSKNIRENDASGWQIHQTMLPAAMGGCWIAWVALGAEPVKPLLPSRILFGDFTYYVSAVSEQPSFRWQPDQRLVNARHAYAVGNDWYFLAGLPTPVTKARATDLGMIFWFVKAW